MNRWDKYFLNMCTATASQSMCLSRQIGAIIVRGKSIISTGYNGPPAGIPHCGGSRIKVDHDLRSRIFPANIKPNPLKSCPRQIMGYQSGEGLEWCPAAHAERNCIANAAKNGVATQDTTMYMSCCVPCGPCLGEIIGAGIKEIVVTDTKVYDKIGTYILKHAALHVRRFGE